MKIITEERTQSQGSRRRETDKFLGALFKNDEGYIEYRGFLDYPRTGGIRYNKHFLTTEKQPIDILERKNKRNVGIFCGACLRARKGKSKKDVGAVNALWVDIDCKDFFLKDSNGTLTEKIKPEFSEDYELCGRDGKLLAQLQINNLPPGINKPSFILDTGHGIHAYWILEIPFQIRHDHRSLDIQYIEGLLKRLTHEVNGDPAVAEIAHVMRVPGFYNMKDPGNPKLSKFITPYNKRNFSLSVFEKLPKIKGGREKKFSGGKLKTNKVGWVAEALRGVTEGKRDATCFRLLGHFKGKRLDKEVTRLMLIDFCNNCKPPFSIEVMEKKLDRAYSGVEEQVEDEEKEEYGLDIIVPTPIKPPEYISTETDKSLIDFHSRITAGNMDPGAYIVQSPTGTGKSFLTWRTAIELIQQGERVLLLFPTKKEVSNCFAWLKQHDFFRDNKEKQNKHISIFTADTKEKSDEKPKILSLSTFGYLGFKGETPTLYDTAKKILEGDVYIFVDECHALFERSIINIPLAARYIKYDGNGTDEKIHHRRRRRCHFRRKAKTRAFNVFDKYVNKDIEEICENRCSKKYDWRSPDKIYKTGEFVSDIQGKGVKKPDLPEELIQFCTEKITGIQIGKNSTLHATDFYYKQKMTIEGLYKEKERGEEEKPDRKGHLKALLGNLIQGCIKFEKPVSIDERDEIQKFPVYPCHIPILSGIDMTPFLQLIHPQARTFFMSATIPEAELDIIEAIAKGKNLYFGTYINQDIPFTFDVTLLETQQSLKPYTVSRIASFTKEKKPNIRIFVVGGDKKQADEIYRKARGFSPEHVMYFHENDFLRELPDVMQAQQNVTADILITYSRSAMTRGENMPDRILAIIDCSQFIPRSALGGILKEGINIEYEMARIIEDNLKQIMGRLFRSLLEREEGKTVQDHTKRIVILCHGVPGNINIQIETSLLNPGEDSLKIYGGKKFISRIERAKTDSIVDNLLLAIEGKDIDQEAIDKAILAERKTNQKSLKQRQMNRKTPEEKRRLKVMKKARGGEIWSAIYKSLSLNRVEEPEKNELYTLYREKVKLFTK